MLPAYIITLGALQEKNGKKLYGEETKILSPFFPFPYQITVLVPVWGNKT